MARPHDDPPDQDQEPDIEAKMESESGDVAVPDKPQVRVTDKGKSKKSAQAEAKAQGRDLKAETKLTADVEGVKKGKVSPPRDKPQSETPQKKTKSKSTSRPEQPITTPTAQRPSKPASVKAKRTKKDANQEKPEERVSKGAPVLSSAIEAIYSRPATAAKSDPRPQVGKAGLFGSEKTNLETRRVEQAPRPGRMEVEGERREKHKRLQDTAGEMVRGQTRNQARQMAGRAARTGLKTAGKVAKRAGLWIIEGIVSTAPIWVPIVFVVLLVVWFASSYTTLCVNVDKSQMTAAQKNMCASYGDTNKTARQRYLGGQMTKSDRAVGAAVTPELRGGYYQNQASVDAAANEHKVGADVIAAVATVESGLNGSWNRLAESDKGALGVMQILPTTWEQYGCQGDQYSAQDSINCGAQILADLQNQVAEIELCEGRTMECVAAAYNGGLGALEDSAHCDDAMKWECTWDNATHTVANTGYQETRDYVEKVQSAQEAFKSLVVK